MASEVTRIIEGLPLSEYFSGEAVLSALAYKPQRGDLFLVGYPKSGTTWTTHIMYNILTDTKDSASTFDLMINFPLLDMLGAEAAVYAPKPSAFRSHLPFYKIPYSAEAKYVYIARNPYDTCVSFYHHTRRMPVHQFQDGTFDEFFELFIQGRVAFGDYFQHVISWYEHNNDPNLLLLTYEELKRDTSRCILKIAEFMGQEWIQKFQENPELFSQILEKTSIEQMKKVFNNRAQKPLFIDSPFLKTVRPEFRKRLLAFIAAVEPPKPGDFVRKGQVGDWKNHFSADPHSTNERKDS
ncbi:hypothetical protein MTO96_000950 [Rhipicephalus appendiculatus]